MKLTVQLQLLPEGNRAVLLRTMEQFNAAAQHAARIGVEYNLASHPGIHRRCYYDLRERYGLSAQMAVRAIGKAVEVLRRDKTKMPRFKPHGAITYDERIISWKGLNHVSLWTLEGRKILPYLFGEYQRQRLDRLRGQVDLVYRRGKFYLLATAELPERTPVEPKEFLGVDLGVVNLATTSDGEQCTGTAVEAVRVRCADRRRRLQREASRQRKCGKRPRSVRRALKRQGGKEARFRRHENHVISKQIVRLAQDTQRGVAVEDLTRIHSRIRFRKAQRARMGGWAFAQLQAFLAYKAKLAGLPYVVVNAAYTSQTCSRCGHCEQENRPEQADFVCRGCGHTANADVNAAQNIAARAAVMQPQGSEQAAAIAA